MSRRPTARRFADSGGIPFVGALHPKSRPSPLLAAGLFVVGSLLIVSYLYHGSGSKSGDIAALNRLDGGVSCTLELQRLIPVLKKAYGDSMGKVLHIGPDTCSVVSQLLKEEDTEAWGIEPYELDDADANCRNLVRKGIVHVADIKFPLPYRPKSFSLVIVSDALDYLSPKYLNKTVPELARVSSDGVVMLSGYPGHQKAKVAELSKFGRPSQIPKLVVVDKILRSKQLRRERSCCQEVRAGSNKEIIQVALPSFSPQTFALMIFFDYR